jgi:hypothetical protein
VKSYWAAICAVVLLAVAPCVQGDQENMKGPASLDNFVVSTWRVGRSGGPSDQVTFDDHKAMELIGDPSPDIVTALKWEKPAILLLANQQYQLSVHVKTENANAVSLKIDLPKGVEAKGLREEQITGTHDWQELKQTFSVSQDVQPEMISVQLAGAGKAFVANFQVAGKLGEAWKKTIAIDPKDVTGSLAANGFAISKLHHVTYYTGRWPMISFLGGMAMGNKSEDLQFFYSEPFKFHSTVLDYVLEGGGKVCGLRAVYHAYQPGWNPKGMRSFLFQYRPYTTLAKKYHPSYILANGRKIWDYKTDKMQGNEIHVPFSVKEPGDVTIDIVVDRNYTPDSKGLAFRMFFLLSLGDPGVKIDLANAATQAEGSPADHLKRFQFGLFPSGYDFWTQKGVPFADIEKNWKPNFVPEYPTDNIYTCPWVGEGPAKGAYHDFMTRYGGCNVAGTGVDAAQIKGNTFLRGALSAFNNPADAKRLLSIDPKLKAFWFRGENGDPADFADVIKSTKSTVGQPDRVVAMYEPFPPSLPAARNTYERGSDLLIFKNEEDPQYNIFMAMGRGAGRAFNRPYGFYWEQTHYPYPSLDEKLDTCILYYLSGGSWISAECDNAPSFENHVVADWVYPYVQALRFAMVHPARGKSIVPVGIVYGESDSWTAPYNPFGQMDTLRRFVEFDSATNTLNCEPSFTHVFSWMPQKDPRRANWTEVGHLGGFIDKLDYLQGYNLLDVFFPQYGDAYTARITRLLTGTPYGPVDFVPLERASVEHLKSFGVLAFLGEVSMTHPDQELKVTEAAKGGTQVIAAVQDFLWGESVSGRPFGLTFTKNAVQAEGVVTGMKEIYGGKVGKYSGLVYSAPAADWETVAKVGDKPLVIRKRMDRGMVYLYLGRWVWQGGDALRPVLAFSAQEAAPLHFQKPDDRVEYVAYQKNRGAWVALFNYGNIVVGCDRLDPKTWRVQPPEPLFSTPTGSYHGTVEFRLDKLGLDAASDYACYEVRGIDGKDFDQVIAGHKTFEVKEVPSTCANGVVTATVNIDKRAEYVIAPKGQGSEVFFGKP